MISNMTKILGLLVVLATLAVGQVAAAQQYPESQQEDNRPIRVHIKPMPEGVNRVLLETAANGGHQFRLVHLDGSVDTVDPEGFAKALKEFDDRLPDILAALDETDALVITADHGNDPTTPSTDHSREYTPLLFYRKGEPGRNLGTRETFSDIAQTAAHFFKVNNNLKGKSFLS